MNRSPYIDGRPIAVDLPLHVTETSDPSPEGTVFVLLHGFGASSYTWRHWAPRLAERGRVLCVDYTGFGAAPKPPGEGYEPADQAERIVTLFEELDLNRVTLVGHSLGGGIALLAAHALLDGGSSRLERMVLISSPAYRQRLPPFVALSRRPRLGRLLIRAVGRRRLIRGVLRSIVKDTRTVTSDMVAAYAQPLSTRDGVDAMMAAGRRILPDDIDAVSDRIRSIRVPTLLIWGDWERVVPSWVGRRLEAELPDAELVELEACGHIPPEEKPAESYAALEAFLDRTDH